MSQLRRPLADNLGTFDSRFNQLLQTLPSTTRTEKIKEIKFIFVELGGLKVAKNSNFAGFSDFHARRSPVNSKVVSPTRNVFVATLRVHQSKLLGMGIGDQRPPTFCTGVLKFPKIVFCAESGAPSGELRIIDAMQ